MVSLAKTRGCLAFAAKWRYGNHRRFRLTINNFHYLVSRFAGKSVPHRHRTMGVAGYTLHVVQQDSRCPPNECKTMIESLIAAQEIQAICGAADIKQWRDLYLQVLRRRVSAALQPSEKTKQWGYYDAVAQRDPVACGSMSELDLLDQMSLRPAEPRKDPLREFKICAQLMTLRGKNKPQLDIQVAAPTNGNRTERVVAVYRREIDTLETQCTDMLLCSGLNLPAKERLGALRLNNSMLRPEVVVSYFEPETPVRRHPRGASQATLH